MTVCRTDTAVSTMNCPSVAWRVLLQRYQGSRGYRPWRGRPTRRTPLTAGARPFPFDALALPPGAGADAFAAAADLVRSTWVRSSSAAPAGVSVVVVAE